MHRRILQAAIVAFSIWHMFCVLVFSLPREAQDPVSRWSRTHLVPLTTPYMWMTSQWQLWNLFAPEPMRRVTYYTVDRFDQGTWKHIVTLNPSSFPWWRRHTQYKLFVNAVEEWNKTNRPVGERVIQQVCVTEKLPPHTALRLTYTYTIIPQIMKPETSAWWNVWRPEWFSHTAFITRCPSL